MLYVTRFTANLWFQFCKPMGKVTPLVEPNPSGLVRYSTQAQRPFDFTEAQRARLAYCF